MQTILSGERAREQLIRSVQALKEPWILAIDGDAAAGKTTLAQALSGQFDAPVVHMDDFFLPVLLRTPERLSQPGGNVHYERFLSQVLPALRRHEAFSYQPFDCRAMDYAAPVLIPASPHLIVEGAYSLHPEFGPYWDLAVFCTLDPQEQLRRIEQRNGSEQLQHFQTRWIPMEKHYQEACDTRQHCQIIYRT